jgi:hypothetical protein
VAITFVGFSADTESASNARNLSLTVPVGTVDGDIMIMVVARSVDGGTLLPTGFTEFEPTFSLEFWTGQGNFSKFHFGYRVASSEPASYDFLPSSRDRGALLAVYSADHASQVTLDSFGSGNGTTLTAPSISPTTDGLLLFFAVAKSGAGSSNTISAVSGMTTRASKASLGSSYAFKLEDQVVAAGATGTRSATNSDLSHDYAWVAMAGFITDVPEILDPTTRPRLRGGQTAPLRDLRGGQIWR